MGNNGEVRRIVVLGGSNAGKTVFITSLIDNLQNYDPDILKLGDEWQVVSAEIANDEAVDGLARFPQEKCRRALVDDVKWPGKTFAASVACLNVRLRRTRMKWYQKLFQKGMATRKLEIVDIAGERVADFLMINCDFRQWSVMMTNQLAMAGIDLEDVFNKIAQTGEPDYAGALLAGYRTVLVELYRRGANVFMTPSTARITVGGQGLGGSPENYDRALNCHPVGLEGREFAPLPESAFNDGRFKDLIRAFGEAYEAYKNKEDVDEMIRELETLGL